MKKIKILVDVTAIDKIYQGSNTYIYQLYKAINEINPNIYLFFISSNKEPLSKYFGEFKNSTLLTYSSENKLVQMYWEIPKILKSIQPDYAHFQYVSPLKSNVKYILTIHDLLIFSHSHFFKRKFSLPRKLLYNYSIKNAERVVSVSKFTSEALRKKHPKLKIVETPNAVDFNYQEKYNLLDVKKGIKQFFNLDKFILYVSRFEKRKNHKLLLTAFQELKLDEQGYQLVFVGADVKSEFEHLNYNFLILAENIHEQELMALYSMAELFVYPSFAEGFGIPPLEALALNTKVLCSNTTALNEFDFFENRFFSPYDKEDLKTKMKLALENYTEDEISNQKEKAKSKYNWNASAITFLESINQY